MKFMVGVVLVAIAGLAAPAMAQTSEAKPKKVRMACKAEAVTGSFTRKAKQCRTAVTATERKEMPKAQAAASPAPATAPTPAPAVTPPQSTTGTSNEPGAR